MDALVETAWLDANLRHVRVLDGSWYLSSAGRDPKAEFGAERIPGARFFDVDAIADATTELPHMLPSPEAFAASVSALGVTNDDHVVVYDGAGLFSAARVWWTFRVFGHERVSVLDGGLPKWKRERRPTDKAFRAGFLPELVRSMDQMKANLTTQAEQVLDARSRERFDATAPEPRAGVRGGHIPGSRSVPYAGLLREDGTVDRDGLARHFAGVDLARPVTTTCGSGITASVLALGLHLLGHDKVAVYDGSWSEWGAADDTPVEK